MIRFLLNPAGGGGKALRHRARLEALAREHGGELQLSEGPADLTEKARQAVRDGVLRLFVCGGDGTQNLALQGLVGTPCALVPLPGGSGNDIVAALGLPMDLEAAAAAALSAPLRAIDVVRVGQRTYAGIAGTGFDAAANETANRVKRFRGPWIYLYAVLHTLATFRAPTVRVRWQGGEIEEKAMLVVAANGPRFGGGMRVAPDALLDDGLLDLVMVRAVSKATFLRIFPRVYKGAHCSHPAVFTARSPWAEIEVDRPLAVYGDGERFGPVPAGGARFEVVPGALRVPDLRPAL
ncbi:MAG TPA: diacylglycerol kinase family protein [Thermoanaerobaculia bacterium]|nr:diacylglycerol kinase family protein [Thermoanaerobaculia bacterium]